MALMNAEAPEQAVLRALTDRGETLATAESLTGGRVAALLTAVPGSSAVFLGGVVSYAAAVKTEVLGVPDEVIADHGVVSRACALAMASGAQRLLGATYAVSTTGVAGPGPNDGMAAGTVWIGVAGPGVSSAQMVHLAGDRGQVQDQAARRAMELLEREVNGLR